MGCSAVIPRAARAVLAVLAAQLLLACVSAPAGASASGYTASAVAATASRTRAVRMYREQRVLAAPRRGSRRLLRERPRHGREDLAREAVVGGTRDAIEQVPWQVAVFAEFEAEGERVSLLCGGAIIDATHILTAGHCTYDPVTETELPVSDFVVVAGATNITEEEIRHGPHVQARLLTSVRRHPYYDYTEGAGAPDDVAVLRLSVPLKTTAAVQPIALPTAQLFPPEGLGAALSGYGLEEPRAERPDGTLNALSLTLEPSRACGGRVEADFLCGRSVGGSACHGDSGSGLTRDLDGVRTLIGLVDFVEVIHGQACLPDSLDGFVNVSTPEIRDFIEGSETPPPAPEGGGATLGGEPMVGGVLRCEPGVWANGPTFGYTFFNGANGELLQQGSSPTYAPSEADVGRSIGCLVIASNAGGIASSRSLLLGPVRPGLASVLSLTGGGALGGPVPKQGVASVTIKEIASQLRREIRPRGVSATVASVLRSHGYTLGIYAPEPGAAVVSWYLAPRRVRRGHADAPVLVASGRVSFTRAGTKKLRLRLTRAGRSLLARSKRVRLTARGTFTPQGGKPVWSRAASGSSRREPR